MKVSNVVSITNNKQNKQTEYNRPKQCRLGTSISEGRGKINED